MKRIYSIDFTRGFVMIIMVLDHVRDMAHVNSIAQSPTDLSTTTPITFFHAVGSLTYAPLFLYSWPAPRLIFLLKIKAFHKAESFCLNVVFGWSCLNLHW